MARHRDRQLWLPPHGLCTHHSTLKVGRGCRLTPRGLSSYAPQACATLTGTASGGNPAYNWSWTNAQGLVLGSSASVTVCPTVTTVYYLTVTDAHGCTRTDSVAVCVRSASCGNNKVQICHRPLGMHSNPQTLCLPTSAIQAHLAHGDLMGPCTSNNSCNAACNFPHGNGNTGSGGSSHHSKVASQAGGAQDADEPLISLRAFPSPTNGSLQIELACMDCVDDSHYSLKITDVFGRELLLSDVNVVHGEGSIRLDLSKYNAGVYMIVIEDGDHRLVERIVKQ